MGGKSVTVSTLGQNPELDHAIQSLTASLGRASQRGNSDEIRETRDALTGFTVCRGISSMLRLINSDTLSGFRTASDYLHELAPEQVEALHVLLEPR